MSVDNDQLTRFLQALVRIPSPPGEEAAAVDLAAREMHRLGFDRVSTDRNGSLIGRRLSGVPGPTLLLDAHLDTVGVASGSTWQQDPFEGALSPGRMHGRGTSDMKGAAAAMIYAAAAANLASATGEVVVCLTVLEEVMEGVALSHVMETVSPDFVVIGEATQLNLNHGGRGRAEIVVETTGIPAHSSSPIVGDNAVLRMLPVLQAIEARPVASDPLLGDGIMVLTDIISEPYPGQSVIPSRCRVTYDRRLLVGEDEGSVITKLHEVLGGQAAAISIAEGSHATYSGETLSGTKFFPAWKLDPAHPFVQQAAGGLRRAGLTPGFGAYQFCTNAAHSAGRASVPTIGFGPSSESQAHVIDEYIELEELFAAARGYLGMIENILGTRSS